jgi:Ca2+-binding RTX toxin-like protein
VALSATATVTDGDGDSVTAPVSIDLGGNIRFDDDNPGVFVPVHALLVDQTATPHTVIAGLNFADLAGADGVGNVVFNFTDGALATDAHGALLKLDGQQLYLHYGVDHTVLVATTSAGVGGTTGYSIDIDPASDTYTLTTFGVISNGFEVVVADLTGVSAGNADYKALLDVSGTTQDVLISSIGGDSINTTSTDIGIANNWIDTGEVARFDFVNGLAAGVGNITGFVYTSHNLASSYRQSVAQVKGGGGDAVLIVTAIIADNDYVFGSSDPGETQVDIGISNIKVFDGVTDVTGSVILTDLGNSVSIDGMQAGWTFQIDSTTPFSAVHVEGGAGDDFALGLFSYSQVLVGAPIDLAHSIIATDGDGDSVASAINATLYPLASSVEGTGTAETITGTSGVDNLFGYGGDDTLVGLLGDDVLSGGDGQDTLIGGQGNDLLSGGADSDTFVWLHDDALGGTVAAPISDVVTDFQVGVDKLDLTGLLDGEQSAVPGSLETYLNFTFGATTTITADSNGAIAGGDIQTIQLAGADLAAHYGGADAATVIAGMLADNTLLLNA